MLKTTISILMITGMVAPIMGATYLTQEAALALAFPDAQSIERKTAFLSESEIHEIESMAKAKVESELVTYYIGKSSDGIMGTAFFESHRVRTMPETIMVVINPQGTIDRVEILSFQEPEDYLPNDRWRSQLIGKSDLNELWIRRGLQNITGATLSAQSITEGTRRLLATYDVLNKEIKK